MVIDAAGNVFMVGTTGSSGNRDIMAVRINSDGALAWQRIWDGPAGWHDTGSGIALSPDGTVVVCGSTPGTGQIADAVVLKLSAADGQIVWTRTFDRGGVSDAVGAVAVDSAGNIYAVGSTVGDGADALIVSWTADGTQRWVDVYDGPSSAPYSQDSFRRVLVDREGHVVVTGVANMSNLHTDFVTTRYRASDGAVLWRQFFGGVGDDTPSAMVTDAAGDIYLTGAFFDFNIRAGTVKYRLSDGQVLWSATDAAAARDVGTSLALGPGNLVCITVRSDPDGNQSNFNDNFYIVARDAASGAPRWTFAYGANCVGCFDVPQAVAIDSGSNVLVAGQTSSPPYTNDMILFRLSGATGQELARGTIDPGSIEQIDVLAAILDGRQNLTVGAAIRNADTGNADFFAARYASLVSRPGDLNGDGRVDQTDLGILLADWGCNRGPGNCPGDADGDGDTDQADLGILLANWGGGM